MNEIELPQGTIRYRDTGSGEPIVLVHGLLVDGELWRAVAPLLARDFRVIVPDLPLGAHRIPMNAEADLTPPGVARLVADFLSALELEDVTLVGNDTGGAICQMVAAHHGERVGRLVLTPCDSHENFLPPMFKPLQVAARVPGALSMVLQSLRLRPLHRTPLAFGRLVKQVDSELVDAWVSAYFSDAGVRRDVRKVLTGISKRQTIEAAERLRSFDRPVLVAWAPENRVFKMRFAERLVAEIPDARLETIDDAYAFVPLDQPGRTAELIASFARERRAEPQPASSG